MSYKKSKHRKHHATRKVSHDDHVNTSKVNTKETLNYLLEFIMRDRDLVKYLKEYIESKGNNNYPTEPMYPLYKQLENHLHGHI